MTSQNAVKGAMAGLAMYGAHKRGEGFEGMARSGAQASGPGRQFEQVNNMRNSAQRGDWEGAAGGAAEMSGRGREFRSMQNMRDSAQRGDWEGAARAGGRTAAMASGREEQFDHFEGQYDTMRDMTRDSNFDGSGGHYDQFDDTPMGGGGNHDEPVGNNGGWDDQGGGGHNDGGYQEEVYQ